MVADRVLEMGAGLKLKGNKPKYLVTAVTEVLENHAYQREAKKLSETLREAGGAVEAANVILTKIGEKS